MDIDPATAAGAGNQRSRVGVSAEGNGIVAWGEGANVYAARASPASTRRPPRRSSRSPTSAARPAGRADSPDIDIEDDGSFAWAVFRQDFGGASRALARRLLGSTFDPPVPLDGGPARRPPRIAMNGRGQGLAAFETAGGGVSGNVALQRRLRARPAASARSPRRRAPSRSPAPPSTARTWSPGGSPTAPATRRSRAGCSPSRRSRSTPRSSSRGPISAPVPAGQFAVVGRPPRGLRGRDGPGRAGDQPRDHRRAPRPPARAARARSPAARGRAAGGRSSSGARAVDLWGPQRFRVVVGGRVVGETTGTSLRPDPAPARRAPDHVPGDRDRRARPGGAEPHARACASTTTRRGSRSGSSASAAPAARCAWSSRPNDGKGSGVREVRVRYGDGTRVVKQRKRFGGRHAYRRGRFTLKVTRLRRGRQPPDQEGQAPHHVRLRAGRRELELGGPPLLMGVVNASPDSFSDARGAARSRPPAPPRSWRRARRSSTSAASPRSAGARRSRRTRRSRASCR